ncbi:MAG: AbrB/MazE/SpoVT family DNA-binding domain-containing protein [Elusimicrobia bacterium]|nr:AbrB/MazE/SpoVT family DNA-binding domain-containing protein [Elusimicrobiota bacterium]
MLRKLGQSYQVAIPRELILRLGLKIEDYLDIRLERGKIVLEPQTIVPRDQAYFYTKEWQKEENQAAQDIRIGRVTKTKTIKDLFKKLDG